MDAEAIPYWRINVPESQWPVTCPEFLLHVSAKDRGILSTRDEDYHVLTWAEVRNIIKTNRIDLFQRMPSDLRRYLEYTAQLKREYGSVMVFILQERLDWHDLTPHNPVPFKDPADIKVLYNDWPYGVDEKIVHLVVWTKFQLSEDPSTGDLTDSARDEIETYVHTTFGRALAAEHIIWFKNWRSLKSIHSVEHFHVMLYDPDPAFIKRITNNDIPLRDKI